MSDRTDRTPLPLIHHRVSRKSKVVAQGDFWRQDLVMGRAMIFVATVGGIRRLKSRLHRRSPHFRKPYRPRTITKTLSIYTRRKVGETWLVTNV
jgi:hypothetical protein